MARSCATKEEEVKKSQATRQQELIALSETIKVLNDDDALELFKKTLPSGAASFLQIQVTAKSVRRRAHEIIRRGRHQSVEMDFIALALQGKKIGMDGIIKMI